MSKVVDVIFSLKDNVTAPMNKVTKALEKNHRQWTRAGRQIQNVGKSISNVGRGMTTSITMPVVAAGTVAVKKFAEVDKTMTLVNSTMKNSSKQADILNKAMESAASNSTYGMNDAAEAALNFARGGWNAEQAAKALAPAMNLAAGEGGDLETVSAGLMATMNSFGAPAKAASEYADVFANACNNSALDVNSLSDAMSVAAPIFKTGGLGVRDAALAMGVMANKGTDANVAANSLKTGMARLASPAKQGAEAMKALGINAFDSNGKMKSMVQVQSELHSAFGKLSAKEKEAAASAIFGKNNMSSWLGLIETAPKDVQNLSTKLGDQGTASKMAGDMMSGFGGSIEKLKSTFDVFTTSMGKATGKVISPFINGISKLMEKISGLNDKQKETIVKIALVAAAIGPALMIFGGAVVKIGKVVSIVGRLGRAIKLAGGVMSLLTSPAAIVVGVLAGIAVAAVLVYKNWDKVKAAAQKMGKVVKAVFKDMGISSKSIKGGLAEVVGKFKALMHKAQELWVVIGPTVKKIGSIFKEVFKGVLGAVIGAAIGNFQSMVNTITTIAGAIMRVFGGVIDFLTGVFTGNWRKAWQGVKDIFGGIFDGLAAMAKAPINAVIGIINGAISGINKIGINIPDWVPKLGGKAFKLNVPKIPALAVGTNYWRGGVAQVSERGGEILDLPKGTRVYPHDKSVQMARAEGRSITINIPKLADSIVIREDSDIDRLAAALAHNIEITSNNMAFA